MYRLASQNAAITAAYSFPVCTRTFLINKLSQLSTMTPEMFTRQETISPDFRPNVSSTHSLLTNALYRLGSTAQEATMLDGLAVNRPDDVRFTFDPVFLLTTNSLCKWEAP